MSSLSAFQGNRIFRHWEAGRSARSLRTRTPSPSQRRLPWMLVAVRPSAPAIELTETLSSQSAIRRRTSSTDHGFQVLGAPPPERLFGGGGQVKRRNALSDLGFLEAEIERERRHAVAGARHSHHQPVDDWPRRRLVWRCLVRRRPPAEATATNAGAADFPRIPWKARPRPWRSKPRTRSRNEKRRSCVPSCGLSCHKMPR